MLDAVGIERGDLPVDGLHLPTSLVGPGPSPTTPRDLYADTIWKEVIPLVSDLPRPDREPATPAGKRFDGFLEVTPPRRRGELSHQSSPRIAEDHPRPAQRLVGALRPRNRHTGVEQPLRGPRARARPAGRSAPLGDAQRRRLGFSPEPSRTDRALGKRVRTPCAPWATSTDSTCINTPPRVLRAVKEDIST